MGNNISSHNIIAGRKARRLTVLLGSVAVCGLFPTHAFAQCTATSPSDYVCEGTNTTGQVITGPVSNVTTEPGFSVSVAGADALLITSTNGDASYIDDNASSLTATGAGSAIEISATNGNVIVRTGGVLTAGLNAVAVTQSGMGTITLDLSGATTSVTGEGVVVRDAGLGGDISVTTGAVTALSGGRDGVDVQSQSAAADVTIVANGDIAAGNAGIVAAIFPAGALGNIDVTANGAIDARFGIDAENFGAGSTAVTTVGPVNATSGHGIFALSAGGAVAVTAGDVTSTGNNAITAQHTGAAGVGAVDVTAGNVSGTTGIVALNNGAGSIGITANGTVTGTLAEGIRATGNGAVSVSAADIVTGTTSGLTLDGGTGGTGDISVVGAGGFVGGTGNAATILNRGSGTVTVAIGGASSSAAREGIFVRDTAVGGAISVTTGAVTALDARSDAIDVQTQSTTANVAIVANGDLQAGNAGIVAGNSSATGTGNIDVIANGAINAQFGIDAGNRGSGSTKVIAVGPVNATTGNGVFAQANGGDIIVSTGDVTSNSEVAIVARQTNAARNGAISIVTGNVSGTTGISGSNSGIGTTSIVANGTVTGAAGAGIDVTGNGAVSVSVADIVTGTTRGLTLVGGTGGAGDISVSGAGGFVGGTGDAANILNNGNGSVSVNISGASSSAEGHGIFVRDTALGGDIIVTTGAVTALAAGKNAIDVQGNAATGDVTVVANGDLQAGDSGIFALIGFGGIGNVDVTANGAINAQTGVLAANVGAGSVKVTTVGPVNVTRRGIDASTAIGGGDITVIAGDVTSTGSDGIAAQTLVFGADSAISVTAGNVSGTGGILAFNSGNGPTDIVANGTVTGTAGAGIDVTGSGAVSVSVADIVTGTTNGLTLIGGTGGAGDISVSGAGGFVGGTGDAANILNNGNGNVIVDISGASRSAEGHGILVRDTALGGDFSVATGAVTALGAGKNAIDVLSISVTGDVTVVANGDLKAYFAAVDARLTNGASTGAIDITAGNASGRDGIVAINSGTGGIRVAANGTVNATDGTGVAARTAGGDITVKAGDVTSVEGNAIDARQTNISGAGAIGITADNASGEGGILAQNSGSGAIEITSTGDVTGASRAGITAQTNGGDIIVKASNVSSTGNNAIFVSQANALGTGNVDVTAVNVSGRVNGVAADNLGTGSTSVTTTGLVDATTGAGISAGSSGGNVTVNAGDVTSAANVAITASQFVGAGAGDVKITTGNVSGTSGIRARNSGSGAVHVVANGTVEATTGIGISAEGFGDDVTVMAGDVTSVGRAAITASQLSTAGAGDIDVTAVNASGAIGIDVFNRGSGATNVTATGAVMGTAGHGISARNTALGGDIGVAAAAVTGTTFGIDVDNRGIGNTAVTSMGDVIATAGTGLRLIAAASTGDLTVNAVNTSGTVGGINVGALGTGDTVVNSTGTATGGTSAGVNVFNGVTSSDITVNANNASGTVGVQVLGEGIGATVVNVTGNTTGTINDGIFARNSQAASTDLTVVNAGTATGARFGIFAGNNGTGVTSIKSTGDAIGGNDVDAAGFFDDAGIFAISGTTANGIIINATNATGFRGIDTENRGVGGISVVATGNVLGVAEGLFAEAQATAGDISISANNVTGGTVGIGLDNAGTGKAVVNIAGVVQGGTAAISSISTDAQALTVNNNGTLRNVSGLSSDSAIIVNGGPLLLNNNGNLLGTLTLFGAVPDEDGDDDGQELAFARGAARTLGVSTLAVGEDDVVNNLVTWNSIGGTSDFGVGADRLNNRASGRIVAATAAGIAETTTYVNLENFSNAGVIALNDGGTGDQLVTDGSVVMESGSTLAIDIGAGNTTDILTVGGSATIQAGAKVAFTQLAPGALGDVHTFLTAADGVTGTFTLVNNLVTLFKGYRVGYTANSAFIEFAQLRALAAAGVTPNQIAAASGVDSLAFNNPIKAAALNFTSDAQAQAAFDALSGEIHPTARTVMIEDSRLPRNAVLERLGADRTATVWGQAFGNWGESDGNRNAASAGRDSYGFLAGADFGGGEEGGLIAGGMVGYIDTDIVVRDRASKASVKTLHGLFYAGIRAGGFSFKAGVGYTRANVDTKRNVVFAGFADSLTDGYKGSVLQGFAEAGYRLPLGEGCAEPYIALTAIRAHSNAVAESGGAAAIKAASTNEKSLMSTTGIRFGTGLSGSLSMTGNVGWLHGFGGLDPVNTHALAGSAPFRIEGAAQSRDAGILGVALRYSITPAATFELGYDGVLGTAAQDHAAKATLRIRF